MKKMQEFKIFFSFCFCSKSTFPQTMWGVPVTIMLSFVTLPTQQGIAMRWAMEFYFFPEHQSISEYCEKMKLKDMLIFIQKYFEIQFSSC